MDVVSNITIREAKSGDLRIVNELAHAIWPRAYGRILSAGQLNYMLDLIYSESSLQKQFEANHKFLIVEENNKPIGFADYGFLKDSIYKLHKIYVLPNQQGKGIGKLLIDYIFNAVKENKGSALVLNVNRNNKAKQVYEHLGFKVISEEDIDIGSGYFMNDYIMSLDIV